MTHWLKIQIGNRWTSKFENFENFEKVSNRGQTVSNRGRFVRGLKKLKNVIAYSCSESLNSHKKTIKFWPFFEKNLCPGVTHLADLTPFEIFFQKSASAKMKPLYSLNFRPKIRKILRRFSEKWKIYFWTVLTPFCPKKESRGFFFKNRFPSLFYIYHPLTVSRKSEKSLEPIPQTFSDTLTDGQTNRQG